jgi:hypothetical protein
MLTGRPPFVATNPVGFIAKHLSEAPPAFPPHLLIPPLLAQACFRALAKNREERQADAISFGDDLQAALAPEHRSAVPTEKAIAPFNSVIQQTGRRPRPLNWITAIVAVLVFTVGLVGFGLAKFGMNLITSNDKPNQNTQNETGNAPSPDQSTTPESDVTSHSTTASDLRGSWIGTYGPLGQPATLVIKSHKGNLLEGLLEQGPILVAFSGTVTAGSVHLKQTRVMRGEGWSLGEDVGTVSGDGKKMSGTGKDALGGSLGMSYEWSFTRQ